MRNPTLSCSGKSSPDRTGILIPVRWKRKPLLCSGINHDLKNSTAYIKGWLKVLDSYPSWILWAASRAQKACQMIVPTLEPDEVETV